ncbi:Os07g0418050 [Oryza sativa Japonica Group]|uniref:Os07g0418050 protein n=2 Tax=Oryza sativa subsp. japonica TaxID=39947 RepID=A3BIZ8_ORYSJ|nr:hypothetical protein OsJ_23974 [Oryza sativa Japonica Group]BAT01163.1 Os07g0418050 [Oryza sativa Japonica Group]
MEGARRQSAHLGIAIEDARKANREKGIRVEKKEGDEKEKGKTVPARFMTVSSRRTPHGAGLYSVVYLPFANQYKHGPILPAREQTGYISMVPGLGAGQIRKTPLNA